MNNPGKILLFGLCVLGLLYACSGYAQTDDSQIKVGDAVSTMFVCKSQDEIEKQIDTIYKNGETDEAEALLNLAITAGECVVTGGAPGTVTAFGKEREPVKLGEVTVTIRAIQIEGKFWTGASFNASRSL